MLVVETEVKKRWLGQHHRVWTGGGEVVGNEKEEEFLSRARVDACGTYPWARPAARAGVGRGQRSSDLSLWDPFGVSFALLRVWHWTLLRPEAEVWGRGAGASGE